MTSAWGVWGRLGTFGDVWGRLGTFGDDGTDISRITQLEIRDTKILLVAPLGDYLFFRL